MKRYFILVLSLAIIFGCSEQKEKENNKENHEPEKLEVEYNYGNTDSLLWEISGNGLEEPSYLFGTVHIIAKDKFFISEDLERTFEESERLVLEIDMSQINLFNLDGISMPDDITLESLVGKEEYENIEQFFKDTLNLNLSLFTSTNMKPIFIYSMIAENVASGETESYELTFTAWAKNAEMEIAGLETIEFQLSVFDSIPYEKQAEMLVESINNYDEAKKELNNLYKYYISNELSKLQDLSNESSSEIMEFEDVLLTKRNTNWINKIEEMASEMQTFFAVGALHLPGKNGVINLLRQKGYTVKPVSE